MREEKQAQESSVRAESKARYLQSCQLQKTRHVNAKEKVRSEREKEFKRQYSCLADKMGEQTSRHKLDELRSRHR